MSRVFRSRKNNELMAAGVTIEDSATTYIDPDVAVGVDTIIHPGVSLEGNTTIGRECEIHTGVRIVDSRIGDRVVIFNHCVITSSTVATEARVGPFAHLRPGSDIRDGARVGNFVELKKTVLGAGSKSMHLAYLGDATIRSQGQRRRRHDHVQLRRRRRSIRPSSKTARSLAATRSWSRPSRSVRRVRWKRHHGPRGCPRRRVGRERREAAQHRGLGQEKKEDVS